MQSLDTHTHPVKALPFPPASSNGIRWGAVGLASFALLLGAMGSCRGAAAQTAGTYQVTNILSDGFVPAAVTDPNFIDPWGVAGGKTLWINTNVTGLSYVNSIAGVISFEAVIPPAVPGSGPGQPTGIVQNTTTGFVLSNGSKASFLFSTGDGTISGWNSAQTAGGNNALIEVNNTTKNAVYTDLALVTNTSGTYLLTPNFGQGGDVEIYNSSFQPATFAGTFTDPNVPAGYAPYAIKSIGSQVFVTYMLRTTPPFAPGAGTYQEILGTNTGFVSVFDDNGNFLARAITGGNLNAPWGVAMAPAGFGIYGGDLLVGNFGDGLITAYNPTTYSYLGTVADVNGKAIAYPGLWSIFGNSTATGSDPTALYFTAGLMQETHGLFGVISNSTTTTTSPAATFNLSGSTRVASVAVGGTTTLTISAGPTNGFTGSVALSCSGLPAGASCSFSPAQLAVVATAPATAVLTIQTSMGMASASEGVRGEGMGGGVMLAMLLPMGSLLALRRRKRFARWCGVGALALMMVSAGLVGCSSAPGTPATPTGTTNVTINATSGSVMQSLVVALTVH